MATYINAREKKENKIKEKKGKIEKVANSTSHTSLSSLDGTGSNERMMNTNSKEDKETKRQKGFTLEQCVSAIRERTKEEGTHVLITNLRFCFVFMRVYHNPSHVLIVLAFTVHVILAVGDLDSPSSSSSSSKKHSENRSMKGKNKRGRGGDGNLLPGEIRNREIESRRLHDELQQKRVENKRYNELLQKRAALPAYSMREEVVDCIYNNRVVVISGDTGCGKSTQIPQLVLDRAIEKMQGAYCNILVTQPRRISAISVSERISEERAESLGGTVGVCILCASACILCGCITNLLTSLKIHQNVQDIIFDWNQKEVNVLASCYSPLVYC